MSNTNNARTYRIAQTRTEESAETHKARFDTTALGAAAVAPRTVVHIGLDFGTNKSCLKASANGSKTLLNDEIVPTVVGYAKEGIVDGLLPDDASMLFGATALKHRLHLNLVAPMVDGVVKDKTATRDFIRHLRGRVSAEKGSELRAVIGVPANAEGGAREDVRDAVSGLFDRVLLVPEPFLAALGFRDEDRLTDPDYVDPVRNSLFVDIGGGTTDVCLVQGYYPSAEDQISFAFAGDRVDAMFYAAIRRTYPDIELSMIKVRELKEQHAFAGAANGSVMVNVMVGGKPRKIDIAGPLNEACEALVSQIMDSVKELISRTSSDSVVELLQNIVLTGGGSQIRGLDGEIQRRLSDEGYERPCVRLAGERYKEFVALGALKAARSARENQWQQMVK
jgi:rod shape-determining protein MreB and related proteins